MLQYRTVYPETLELLEKLMRFPDLQDFYLVGGTALALQKGHRFSVDIDMFTAGDFDSETLISSLEKEFDVRNASFTRGSVNLDIAAETEEGLVKVDLIRYSYPLINPILSAGGIRLLSVEDISAMKLSAIAGRGSKKDFYDIYYLLKDYSFDDLFAFFSAKFPSTNHFQVLKSLTYFSDADMEPDPVTFEAIPWESVKQAIVRKVNTFSGSQDHI